MVCFYCLLRFVSVGLVYDFIDYLGLLIDQEEKLKEAELRNHYWYQLSIYHQEKDKLKLKEVSKSDKNKNQCSSWDSFETVYEEVSLNGSNSFVNKDKSV